MSVLCKKCEVIRLNDAVHNGFRVSKPGQTYLGFNEFPDPSGRLLLDYELRDTFPDLPELSHSAASGCELCILLKDEIAKFRNQTWSKNQHHTKLHIHKLCYTMSHSTESDEREKYFLQALFVHFNLSPSTETDQPPAHELRHALRLDIQAEPNDPCTQWLSIPRRAIERDVLSEAGIRRLYELREALLAIPNLSPASQDPPLPTRLIDVGFRGPNEQIEEPRLVITTHYPPLQSKLETHQYIALSYCWGPPKKASMQLKTQKDTLSSRLNQIPFSTLPGAHQDAVRLCRALGVRYIWIDSLCIIQDDTADWEREAAQMGSVYANAYLTICAAQGDSCLDGFLQRPYPSHVINVPFTSSVDPSVSGSFSIFASSPTIDYVQTDTLNGLIIADFFRPNPPPPNPYRWASGCRDTYERDINGCSWNGRGWTFQERMLSPRILLFGGTMIYACSGNVLIRSEDAMWNASQEPPSHMIKDGETPKETGHHKAKDWHWLVQDYSRRSLTYPNDALPAISALAMVWAGKGEGEYLAGLFSSDLSQGLLWAHEGVRTPAQFLNQKPEEYTAPSWSWASQPDAVQWLWYIKSVFEPVFHLSGSCITPHGLNPYGRVKSGHLLLSTKMCDIPATRLRREPQFLGFIFPYELLSKDGTVLAHLRFDWRHESFLAPKDPNTGEELEDGPIEELRMVLITSKVTEEALKRDGDVPSQDLLLGLLVLATGSPGEYRRAGLFFTETDGPGGRKFWDQCDTQDVKLV